MAQRGADLIRFVLQAADYFVDTVALKDLTQLLANRLFPGRHVHSVNNDVRLLSFEGKGESEQWYKVIQRASVNRFLNLVQFLHLIPNCGSTQKEVWLVQEHRIPLCDLIYVSHPVLVAGTGSTTSTPCCASFEGLPCISQSPRCSSSVTPPVFGSTCVHSINPCRYAL